MTGLLISFLLSGCDNKFEVTKTETTTDDSGITQSITSHTTSDNDDTVTTINVQNSSSYPGSIAVNGDNIDFKNDKMYINGKEVDIDTAQGVTISTNNNNTVVNGQTLKNKKDNPKDILLTLTGKTLQIPVKSVENLSSHFNLTQKCSDSNNSYFLIDSALEPYILKDKANSGLLYLDTGNYKIKGKIQVELYTPALKQINYNSYGSLTLSCVDKNSFSLENNGIGKIVVDNIDNDNFKVAQSGSGIINLQGKHINNLYAENNGIGAINIDVKVKQAQLENSGVGVIRAKEIGILDSENSGIGSITVDKTDKIIREKKNSLDSMFEDEQ